MKIGEAGWLTYLKFLRNKPQAELKINQRTDAATVASLRKFGAAVDRWNEQPGGFQKTYVAISKAKPHVGRAMDTGVDSLLMALFKPIGWAITRATESSDRAIDRLDREDRLKKDSLA